MMTMMMMGEWVVGLTASLTVSSFPTCLLCKFVQTIDKV